MLLDTDPSDAPLISGQVEKVFDIVWSSVSSRRILGVFRQVSLAWNVRNCSFAKHHRQGRLGSLVIVYLRL